MLVVVALGCFLLICGYELFWRRSRSRQCLGHLPTYPMLPFIGNAHYLIGDGRQTYFRLLEVSKICEEKQLPFVVWMGPLPCILFSNLNDIKAVSNEFIQKPYYYNFFQHWLGDGIFTAPATTWKRNIKKLAGTFNTSMVNRFQTIFNLQAHKLVRSLKTEVGQGPCNVMDKYLAKTSLDAIFQIASGILDISDSIVTPEYYKAFMKNLEIIRIRGFNLLLHSDFLFGLTSYKKEMMEAVEKIHCASERVLKIKQLHQNPEISNEIYENNTGKANHNFKSYLDILLELNAKDPSFTTEQMRNEIDTIIFGGHETVATTLFYALLMIGCYPHVQDKLYAEIKYIFGNSNRDVTKEDLARMTYCEAVVYETLRLYPPVPIVMRVADHELQLKSCTVPKGVTCAINIFAVGRSKTHWGPDADEFRPERFQSDSIPALLSFSTGMRACIGKKYAVPILKTIIAHCVRELVFTVEPNKIELSFDIILRTVCKEILEVKLRQK